MSEFCECISYLGDWKETKMQKNQKMIWKVKAKKLAWFLLVTLKLFPYLEHVNVLMMNT